MVSPKTTTTRAFSWALKNPGKTVLVGFAGAGISATLAPAAISTPILDAAGFGADGVKKDSIAADVQSGKGNVVAPSTFATLQSAAMGGYGATTVNSVVSIGGGIIALASGGAVMKAVIRKVARSRRK